MDDIIFEKDYRETESAEYDKWCDEVFDRAVNCGMLKAYSEAMDKIPKDHCTGGQEELRVSSGTL